MYNLHLHTNKSDGNLSPIELINLAKDFELRGISITDHDTIDAYMEAIPYSKEKDIELILGLELSTDINNPKLESEYIEKYGTNLPEIHLLIYNFDIYSKKLHMILKDIMEKRNKRGLKIIKKLINDGFNIFEDTDYQNEKFIGRVKIANELINTGYASSIKDAFAKYLNYNRKYYVKRESLSLDKAIKLAHDIGGIAVFAHPGEIISNKLRKLVLNTNIDGIECFHPRNSAILTKELIKEAKNRNLIITGGSDFHGTEKSEYKLLKKYTIPSLPNKLNRIE